MAALVFDHIVHFIDRDPSSAIFEWKKHGLHAVKGGSHLQWGSWNSLLYFGLSYVEYLAIEHDAIARTSSNPLIQQMNEDLQKGEGFGTICFRTHNLQSLREQLVASGFTPGVTLNAERIREDGTMLRWKMMFVETPSFMVRYPFFIQWEQDDSDRFKEFSERGMIPEKQQHLHVNKIDYAVPSPEEYAAHWGKLLQSPESSVVFDEFYKKEAILLQVGNVELKFIQGKVKRPIAIHVNHFNIKKSIELFNGLYVFSSGSPTER